MDGALTVQEFNQLVNSAQGSTLLNNLKQIPDAVKALSAAGFTQLANGAFAKVFGGTIGAAAAESSEAASVLVPATLTAAEGTMGVDVTVDAATVMAADGTTAVNSGIVLTPKNIIVGAVAAAAGFALTYDLTLQVVSWLDDEYNFDWSKDSVGAKIITYVQDVQGESFTYISQDLIKKLWEALYQWGLFEAHTVINPIYPTYNEPIKYLWENRFPSITNKYVARCEELITAFNPYLYNDYVVAMVDPFEKVSLYILDLGEDYQRLNVKRRHSLMNSNRVIFKGDELFNVSSPDGFYVNAYSIDANGMMEQFIRRLWVHSYSLTAGTSLAIWDNFGEYFRVWERDGETGIYEISAIGSQITDIPEDPNRTDVMDGDVACDIPTTFPGWWDDRINVNTPQIADWVDALLNPDAINVPYDPYLPINFPWWRVPPADIDQDDAIDTPTDTPILEDVIDNTDTDIPDTGEDPKPTPTNPPAVTPTVPELPPQAGISDSGMIDLYNPTENELAAFSSWLWSTDFTTTIQKLLQNPMDAIIGLHKIFAVPTIKAAQSDIYVGSYKAGTCKADRVYQYTMVDCGEVELKPYFNNIHDYISTKVDIFLPFIGIVPLKVDEVINKIIHVKYQVDFLTGTALCYIYLRKRGSSSSTEYVAYTFSCNIAVQLPLTGANYAGILANIIGVTVGIGATVASGGAAAPVLISAAGSALTGSQSHVEHGGQIGSNAGAMGIKVPYIIITRNVAVEAFNKGRLEGLPQYITARLGSLTGYTRVKYINLEGLGCTEEEKADILSKLQGGVII